MSSSRTIMALAVIALAAFAAACDEPRDVRTETRTVALEGAARVDVRLDMNAGELEVRGADQDALLEASFEYNRDGDRPAVDYSHFGDKGTLQIRRLRRSGGSIGPIRNRWDLRLRRGVPLELDVDLGAGQSDLDLRGLQLRGLGIDMGVGEMRLDLRGPHEESFDVTIDGGIGSGRIIMPSDVGVRIRVDGGLGSIKTRGLMKKDGVFTNEAYGRSAVTIEIDIDAGIGSLDLRVESPERTGI